MRDDEGVGQGGRESEKKDDGKVKRPEMMVRVITLTGASHMIES